ncbi:MAG: tryptophan--tRNA ligase [Candidatus Omnitrophica bacterium]|nr:tryptophan--tRNA ligase [Candidatus Omnitrophota bacterium]MBU1924429.1 tryptophan--tRNA ligase [Candidatus Omnitrophota bacterium]
MKKRILSGMRPTGKLHLGHLVGALKNWSQLQDKFDCFFMVADWHALMSEYENTASLNAYILDNVIDWLACGIDPEKSVLFIQSQIPEHLELAMIFSCVTPLGWLERCPTYKEQLRELRTRQINTYAFLGYPVLQAADILLYRSEVVPVGEDQLPHLELTREIAKRFNHIFKKKIFGQPQAELTKVPRLLGLDGRKMSKSYDNFIALSDDENAVKKKAMSMFTDPKRLKRTDPGHPEVCNVYEYYGVFSDKMLLPKINSECKKAQRGCTDCKMQLGQLLCEYLEPIWAKRTEFLKDKNRTLDILAQGKRKAQKIAQATMDEVRESVGL